MSIEVFKLRKNFGATAAVAEVSFSLASGHLLALLGPSGSGKTTVLRMLAGLEQPDGGAITMHDRAVFGGGRETPPEGRDIGMVFQDYALWPHMTVAQNIAFGLRVRPRGRSQAAARVDEALALVHLEGLGARYPDQLSGGQQQRVAIARAIAARPRLLLLDEPLSNLDATLREEMRLELGRLLKAQEITAIYVTHDRIEALAMADEIIVMRAGRVVQAGSPEELYTRPINAFIAGFLGAANFVAGEVQAGADGRPVVRHGDLCLRGVVTGALTGRAVAMMRPEDGLLSLERPGGAEGNCFAGELVYSEFLGGRWRHVVSIAPDLHAHVVTADRASARRVWVRFPVERCLLLAEE